MEAIPVPYCTLAKVCSKKNGHLSATSLTIRSAVVPPHGLYSLSQTEQKLHHSNFFSRKYNPTQQRYGVGARELLAINWTLEEWCYWLQGGSAPFTVWTNHQNLISIQQVKKLNQMQVRWALVFEPIDALSRQQEMEYTRTVPASSWLKSDFSDTHLGASSIRLPA